MSDPTIQTTGFPWLTAVVFLPLAGAVMLFFVKESLVRWTALVVALADLGLSLPLWLLFDPSTPRMQFTERVSWIASPSINYSIGIDGISLPLLLLTTFLTPLCVLASWKAIEARIREFMATMLIMETAMLGVFVALDLVLFYVFWEAMLIPMYLIIGVWGGPNRLYAALKFFLYPLVGSVLLLIAILAVFFHGGQPFDMLLLSRVGYSPTVQNWVFWAFFVAFAIKVPMSPFHTWLPDAHVEAPTAGSVILAGVLLKMGTYGFLRFGMLLFPVIAIQLAPAMMWLAVIGLGDRALAGLLPTDRQ